VLITKRPLFYWILHRQRPVQLALLLIILAALFFRVVPLEMQKRIVNDAIRLQKVEALYLYCGLYIGAALLASLLKFLISMAETYIGQKILVELRRDLYSHILQLPLQFFRRTPPGTVITSLASELNAVGYFLGGALAIPVTSILTFFAFAGYMIYLDPLLALLSLAIYPLEIILVPLLQRRYNRLNSVRVDVTRDMSNVISEAISGIHEIQGNASFGLELTKYGVYVRRLYQLMNKLLVLRHGIKFANNFFQNMGPFILFLVGGYFAIQGQFTLGALVAFLSAYEKVYDPWREMLEYYQDFQDAQVRYHRVMDYFDLEPEAELLPPAGREPYRLSGGLEARELGYVVDRRIRLLNHISLAVQPGEHVAIVGFSGSGKSTLAMLLGQLYQYSEGQILVGGRELRQLSRLDVAQNIGFVAQHSFIFSGTIRDNIIYGCRALLAGGSRDWSPLPETAKIIEIVREVGLGDDLVRFGLNTIVPRGRCAPLEETLIRMRVQVRRRMGKKLGQVVEFYDINRFLHYASIYSNIIFGDFDDQAYGPENVPHNRQLMRFLAEKGLEEPLVQLGREVAQETVLLLKDLAGDPFFFEMSPIKAEEFEQYRELVAHQGGAGGRFSLAQRRMLLVLALRYIPGRHKVVALPPALSERIVRARQQFLAEIAQVDVDACRRSTAEIETGAGPLLPVYTARRDFTSYCPSQYQYSHTLFNNIVFGTIKSEHASAMAELWEVSTKLLAEAGLLEEVMDIGLDFDVGSKGDRLSGGQRQKIALARALLKEPPILILDEATANLDNTSQARIQRLLATRLKGGTTVIAIIHRLDMASGYDRIVVLKAGEIVESGSYAELMAKQGVFHGLVGGT